MTQHYVSNEDFEVLMNDAYKNSFGTYLKENYTKGFYNLYRLWRRDKFKIGDEKEKVLEKCKRLKKPNKKFKGGQQNGKNSDSRISSSCNFRGEGRNNDDFKEIQTRSIETR
jgi:hypothetical protein